MQKGSEIAVGTRGLCDESVELLEESGDDRGQDGTALLLVMAG